MLEDSDSRNKKRTLELERELEDKTSELENYIKEIQAKSEEQLA